jgi:hypothetical protein
VARLVRSDERANGVKSSFHRTADCGMPMGEDVEIHLKGGTAYPVGVATCGSVWVCAACSAKIRTRRAVEVQTGVDVHRARGGDVAMLTLTARHKRWMSLSKVLDGVMGSWRKMQQGPGWRGLRGDLVGTVRSLEVTVGDNGWHPHLHVLLLVKEGVDRSSVERQVRSLRDVWRDSVLELVGLAPSHRRGSSLVWFDSGEEYVSKLQEAGLEVAYADGKRGRYPFGLLEGVASGEVESLELWREYADTMKGRRALEWSRGLRGELCLGEEATDEELAVEDVDGQVIAVVTSVEWVRMMWQRHSSGVLMVEWYLRRCELEWWAEHGPPDGGRIAA